MSIFQSPSPYPLGLDISDRSLKLVQLNRKRNKVMLEAISKWRVPPGYIEQGVIKKSDKVAELIQNMKEATIFGRVTSTNVIADLPETKTFIQLLTVEPDGAPFNHALVHEIEKNIPFNITEVNYDWQIVQKERGKFRVLVAAIEKYIAQQYYEMLIAAGLQPVSLEIEAVAIARSILPVTAKTRQSTLILDIGAQRSSCIVYANNTILFTASLPISSNKVTKAIATKLNISHHKAEAAKIVCGLDRGHADGVIAQELEEKVKNITTKLREVMRYLNKRYPDHADVSRIYLCGGGSQIHGLTDVLSKRLKIPTYIGNVLINLDVSHRLQEKYLYEEFATLKSIARDHKIKQNFSLQFATAVGLALRGIYHHENV